jgi:hypothetical protein
VTEQTQVDWDDVETRARRRELLAVPVLLAVLGALFGLMGRFAFWEGRAAWIALAVYAGLFVVTLAVSRMRPELRDRQRGAYRLQHAVAHHVDPGPELRDKADALVRRLLALSWSRWWIYLVIPVGPLLTARWGRPLLTVPCALVVVSATVALALAMRRSQLTARRWAESPPGPPREIGPPVGWERWLTARRTGLVLLVLFLVAVAGGTAVIVLR